MTPLTVPEVQFTLLDVVEGTAIGEFVDDGFRLEASAPFPVPVGGDI